MKYKEVEIIDLDRAFETQLEKNRQQNDVTITIKRRLQIHNDDGEYSLRMVLVVEDFRVAFYIATLANIIVVIVLTKVFTTEDYSAIIKDVFGASNVCVYFDYPPSTYVLPLLWCFPIILGFLYSAFGILRIRIAFLEKKLTKCESVLLTIVYVYMAFSVILVLESFVVQPDREKPYLMIQHTLPYLNLKIMLAALQLAVVYFGIKVSWVGLKFPRWFNIASIVHAVSLVVVSIFGTIYILNALGDMGEKGLEGKGLWWSVKSEGSIVLGEVFVNVGGMILDVIIPLIHAAYICRNGVNTHALIVAVSDNRMAAPAVL